MAVCKTRQDCEIEEVLAVSKASMTTSYIEEVLAVSRASMTTSQ